MTRKRQTDEERKASRELRRQQRAERREATKALLAERNGVEDEIKRMALDPDVDVDEMRDKARVGRERIQAIESEIATINLPHPAGWDKDGCKLLRTIHLDDGTVLRATISMAPDTGFAAKLTAMRFLLLGDGTGRVDPNDIIGKINAESDDLKVLLRMVSAAAYAFCPSK